MSASKPKRERMRSFDSEPIPMDEESLRKAILDQTLPKDKADVKILSLEHRHEGEKDAFVESLNGSDLFKSMFEDDPKAETLHCVPEVAHLRQTFEDQFVEKCIMLFKIGLVQHKEREREMKSFFTAQEQAVTDKRQQFSSISASFELQHNEWIAELQQLSDPDQLKEKMNHCHDEITQLCKSLITLDFQLVSQLEGNIKKFNNRISEMVGNFKETALGIFKQCRDLEDDYNEKIIQILENVTQENLDLDLPDDVKTLFENKDTVMEALITSHINHLLKITDREIQLVTCADAWKKAIIEEIQNDNLKHKPERITDIFVYVDHLRERLEKLQ